MKLDRRQIERYFEDGFLIVEDLLSREDVQGTIDDIAAIVDELARRLVTWSKPETLGSSEDLWGLVNSLDLPPGGPHDSY